MYNIDDVILAQFCINVFKENRLERYRLFKDYLHTWHTDSGIYEDNPESFMMYISHSIMMNALELNKTIFSYEEYFYNVILGFGTAKDIKIQTKTIARVWNNLIIVFKTITDKCNAIEVKNINRFVEHIAATRFINTTPVNVNIKYTIPLEIENRDYTTYFLFIPDTKTVKNNMLVLQTLNKIKITDQLIVFGFNLNTAVIEVYDLNITERIKRQTHSYLSRYFVDFSYTSQNLCKVCPISCTIEETYKGVLPHFKDKRKIKVLEK